MGTRDERGTFALTLRSKTGGRLEGLLWKMSAVTAALQ